MILSLLTVSVETGDVGPKHLYYSYVVYGDAFALDMIEDSLTAYMETPDADYTDGESIILTVLDSSGIFYRPFRNNEQGPPYPITYVRNLAL